MEVMELEYFAGLAYCATDDVANDGDDDDYDDNYDDDSPLKWFKRCAEIGTGLWCEETFQITCAWLFRCYVSNKLSPSSNFHLILLLFLHVRGHASRRDVINVLVIKCAVCYALVHNTKLTTQNSSHRDTHKALLKVRSILHALTT